MNAPRVSVIIPTHNRHEKLAGTVASLRDQSLPAAEYEIVVVDDGSTPPVKVEQPAGGPTIRVLRLEGVERSIARNTGAREARGELLVFLDNDMEVGRDFVQHHWQGYQEWPGAIQVGAILLASCGKSPAFYRFRHRIENSAAGDGRGPRMAPNFCAAGNMAISRQRFFELGGFAEHMVSSEDQDLALRHTGGGGQIVYLPEAAAVHHDGAMDIRSYCRRHEWGAEKMMPFCRRWPDWPDNVERERINGPVRWGREPWQLSLRKIAKSVLGVWPAREALFLAARVVELAAPESRLLDRLYRLLFGIHLFRGYRRGRKQPQALEPRDVEASCRQPATAV